MAFDRAAAKQAGYTDEEIDSYLQNQAGSPPPPPPVSETGEPPAPTTTVGTIEPTAASIATTAGLAAAPYVLPTAGALAAGYGGSKVYGAWRAGTDAAQALAQSQAQQAQAAMAQAAADRAAAQGLQQRFEQRMSQQAGSAVRPAVTPAPTYNVPTSNVPQMRTPMPTAPGPVAPAIPPVQAPAPLTTAAQPGIMQRGMDIANQMRQVAAQRVVPVAANFARGSAAPAMALYSGELNSNEQAELERRRRMAPTITR